MIGRHLFQNIDNRILFGITTFVVTMVLLGWVAINERPRMAAFERQFSGRSIENGAALFLTNCASCHGLDGLGIAGFAPALDNPQLFGHDFLAAVDEEIALLRAAEEDARLVVTVLAEDETIVQAQIASWEAQMAELESGSEAAVQLANRILQYQQLLDLDDEAAASRLAEAQRGLGAGSLSTQIAQLAADVAARDALVTEFAGIEEQLAQEGEDAPDEEQLAVLEQRQEELNLALAEMPDSAEAMATLQEAYDRGIANLAELEANDGAEEEIARLRESLGLDTIGTAIAEKGQERDALVTEMTTAIARGYDPERPNRIDNIEWAGTFHSFLFSTISSGRPVSISYWGGNQQMPAWSNDSGGPLRDDEINDLANFIANYDRDWTMSDLLAVNQFALEPGLGGPSADVETIGRDVDVAMNAIASLVGDPIRGESLYLGESPTEALVVLGCASCHQAGNAPETGGTWGRIVQQRMADPQFSSYTAERYFVESVLLPAVYGAPGNWAVIMPTGFPDQLTAQDLADLLAFIQTQE
ncbi:MAG: c-type cytochrome [Anaerolineaceae bacterium]|nr:c-type cytochrome [Anaerolineaceae bacterium]